MMTPSSAPSSAPPTTHALPPSYRPESDSPRTAARDQFLRNHPVPVVPVVSTEQPVPTPVPYRLHPATPMTDVRWLIGMTAPFWLAAIALCSRCQGSFGRLWIASLSAACGVTQGIAIGIVEHWISENF